MWQFAQGALCFAEGKIRKTKEYQFEYSIDTEPGSSGSPVILKKKWKSYRYS
jgi:V8-like Glu-specific endopeptidase